MLVVMIIGIAMAEIGRGDEEEWVAVPGGYRHRDCVSFLPSGSQIAKEGEGYRVKHPSGYEEYKECAHKEELERGARVHGRAWKTWAQYHNTTAFTSMSAQWAVPSSPTTQRNQILYFWPGTEPDDNSFVIQPVLQWGNTPAGGANYWAVTSWYVGDFAFFSTLLNATSGSSVGGSMVFSSTGGGWNIYSENSEKESVSLFAQTTVPQTYAYIVLEAYNLIDCTEYPASETAEVFTNIVTDVNYQPSTPDWQTMTKAPRICNEHTVIDSSSQVEIQFENS